MAGVLTGTDAVQVFEGGADYAPVFAYGTLRPGEVLADLLDVAHATDARVHGMQLWTWPGKDIFPIMVPAKHQTVIGELLWVERNENLLSTVAMELRSGYDLSIVNVYTNDLEEYVPAISFTMEHPPIATLPIPSNNWKVR